MQEILFRGKQVDNNAWVFGWYAMYPFGSWPLKPCIISDCASSNGCYEYTEIDSATVGQYTGLTDKNGVKIFEGDIVHITGNQAVEEWKDIDYNAQIVFLDGGFCAIDGTVEEHSTLHYALARMDFELEVIGNVHDNPGLLKEV